MSLPLPKGKALVKFAASNLDRQREGGGGCGTDDDCRADDCALGCGGLGWGMEAACWAGGGGVDDIFCLMSSSTACSAEMFWAICSCLAASCSTLRRTTSRLDAKGASCSIGSVEVAATTGDFVGKTDNTKASARSRAAAGARRTRAECCQPGSAATPVRTVIESRARA